MGVSVDAAAANVIKQMLFDYDDYDWGADRENDPRRAAVGVPVPNEPTSPAHEVLAQFDAELRRRLAARR